MKKLFLSGLIALSTASVNAQVHYTNGGVILPNIPPTNVNVGIGNNTPLAKLSVRGNALFSNINTPPASAAYIRGNSVYSTALTPDYTWWNNDQTGLFHPGGDIIGFTSGGTEKMRIAANGNVGIGINAPTQKLHVNNGLIMISGANSFGGAMIVFSDNIAANAYPNGRWGIEYEPTAKGLNFWQPWNPSTGGGGNYYMFLNNNGKVGIGIDPTVANSFPGTYRLYVKEGILTEKVKVAVAFSANWSDYVFANDYKLKSLQEVEAFVKANKHLPGIPSAEQMVKEGNDLGATDAKLLEKIEELTLYMIELNKKVTKLDAENAALKLFVSNFKQ